MFLPEEKLIQATATLLSVDAATVQAGLRRLEEAEHAVQDHLAGIDIAYLPELYEAEQYVARRLGAMAADRLPEPPNLESLVGQAQQAGICGLLAPAGRSGSGGGCEPVADCHRRSRYW